MPEPGRIYGGLEFTDEPCPSCGHQPVLWMTVGEEERVVWYGRCWACGGSVGRDGERGVVLLGFGGHGQSAGVESERGLTAVGAQE
jgi:hypothetical protein